MGSIRLLVVDDHPVVRNGIKCALASARDIQVVGEADSASSALRQVVDCQPDVILLDMLMPGSSGGVAVRRLKEALPTAKIIVLTTFEDSEYLFAALEAGADAYILKSIPLEELASTIRAVQNGERLLSPPLVGKLMDRFQNLSFAPTKEGEISDFERRILELLATGATNKEIAEMLFASDSTIKRKMEGLFQKLGATDRVQLAVEAINRGLI